jgi:hypothetical protein
VSGVPELLSKAADLIEANGLNQGSLAGKDGKCLCVLGAIRVAAGAKVIQAGPFYSVSDEFGTAGADYWTAEKAVKALSEHLDEWPPAWNDRAGTTQDEVVAELRQCAAIQAEKEAAA